MEMVSDNKRLILETAIGLFAARGYDGVGVSEIVENCSLTKPTLYHYFGSKLGLIQAILADRFEPFLGAMAAKAAYARDLVTNLDACADFLFERVEADPEFFRFMLASGFAPEQSEAGSALRPWNEKYFRVFEDLFAQAAKDHGNMKHRQTAYAAAYIGTLHTHASLMLAGYGRPDPLKTRRIVHYFMHGIFS
jgi:AcrR family transcriptional regulator